MLLARLESGSRGSSGGVVLAMSSMFDEAPLIKNRNADLLEDGGQSPDSDFLRRSPEVEDFDLGSAPRRQGPPDYMASARRLISDKGLKPAKESWKLFSPSTWGFLRNTAWGRKKAHQRHVTSVANSLRSFFSPGSGAGTPYVDGTSAGADPNLASSKANGMHADDAQAWGALYGRGVDIMVPEGLRTARAAMQKPEGEGRMGRRSFLDMVTMANRRVPGERRSDGAGLAPGTVLDGHAVLDAPGDDAQDRAGDGIPSIVKDVFGGKSNLLARSNSGGGAPPSSHNSIEEEIKDDGQFDQPYTKSEQAQMLAAMGGNKIEEEGSESSDDDW